MGKWLVTSAWPYINYMPHLGTIIGSVLSADVAARYLRLKGEEVLFVSGSDEHGTPIEVEAIKQGIHPRKLTDKNHARIKELFERWEISFDNYTRTESDIHKQFTRQLFSKIYENGFIYTEKEVLPYCTKDKRFLPDRFIEGICPHCSFEEARGDQCDKCGYLLEPTKLVEAHCTICGSAPDNKETTHWYFDLPKFSDKLTRYIKENQQLPDNARNFTLQLIREGLKSRSLTRDNDWGIEAPFPDSQGKTIYVWMEAVLGYISAAVEHYKNSTQPDKWREFWFNHNARTLFFIGKDNIPFHTIILPALLLATKEDYNLPWNVSSTEFLMFEGEKFSKSRRIGVWIDEALDLYPADYWRYTLLSIRPESKDTNFTWDTFIEKVNSDLNDTIGNFVHRTLTFIGRYFDGKVPSHEVFDAEDREAMHAIDEYSKSIAENIENFKLQAAVNAVTDFARIGNKYINDRAPWKTIKEAPKKAATTLYVASQLVKALSIFLLPFIPKTAEATLSLLSHTNAQTVTWKDASRKIAPGTKLKRAEPLFTKIDPDELKVKITRKNEEATRPPVSIQEFGKLDLRVGKVLNVEEVPKSDKLLKLTIDIGEQSPKIAIAGVKQWYKPEELFGKYLAVVANIQPTKIFGLTSEIMIMAAESDDTVSILEPHRNLKPGSKIR